MHATQRNRISAALAVLTAVLLGAAFFLSPGRQTLMPGPLASVHGTIEACSACHAKSGTGKVSWVRGLIAGDPLADSKACLVCHKMPETAFNPHGTSKEALARSTKRLRQAALRSAPPLAARVQNTAFPMSRVVARALYCATCHQEHQGTAFKLSAITNEQCRSCHAVKFDTFEGGHPELESYPFRRRTRLVFDHRGHFDRHFPEIAKKGTVKRIPDTCGACHDSRNDRRIMAVAAFDETCATCHLDQITGKARASGPKGIAFLTLPGLDLATLEAKTAKIGEWPESSEATLTPFMALMIGRDESGRALLKTVEGVNLQDLSNASGGEIKAVAQLAWAIKRLYYTLLTSKGSGALSGLDNGGSILSPALVADLTASLPRDVIATAQQEWLPHLAEELGEAPLGGAAAPAQPSETESAVSAGDQSDTTEPPAESIDLGDTSADTGTAEADTPDDAASDTAGDVTSSFAAPAKSKLDPPPCSVSIFGACLVTEEKKDSADATVPVGPALEATEVKREPRGEIRTAAAGDPPAASSGGQRDELLFPTDKELEDIKSHYKAAGQPEPKRVAPSEGGGVGPGEDAEAPASADAGSAGGEESGIDPESWADYGGWYRQDYAIYYSPVGHRDRFLYAWLKLVTQSKPSGDAAQAAVLDELTAKDAPGACSKCHSIDGEKSGSRRVNFAPLKAEAKQARFTAFIHEPHLSVVGDRGCLTCHDLGEAKAASAETGTAKSESAYLASYTQGDPTQFAPEFGEVKKETCQSCHTAGEARQDCLLCHAYHIDGVVTPITSTKLPVQ
ncbi:MAG: hypothetical protein U1E49_00845 [Hyphomicrobiaceae bacterium]